MGVNHVNDEHPKGKAYQQVKLTLQDAGCWTVETTEEHPGTHIIEKFLYPTDDVIKGDFILATRDDTSIDEFLETIDRSPVVEDVTLLRRSVKRARVVVSYTNESSIVPEIGHSKLMPIAPVHVTKGKEHWRMMVEVNGLSEALGALKSNHDVDVDAIERVDPQEEQMFADVVDEVNDALSPRQREILFDALAEGYYNWPRDRSANEVAEAVGISSPTLLEHLRQGEQKIIHTVLEELKKRNKQI